MAGDTLGMPTHNDSLQNNFLIAMPQMHDPNFSGSLTYICEHNEYGAMGIIVNRPTALDIEEVLEQLEIPCQSKGEHVYSGGPVQIERGFILHTGTPSWESSMPVSPELSLTTSRDILEAIGSGSGPDKYILALGYAGWGEGQLERELKENAWLTCTANLQVLFDIPDEAKFKAAVSILGIDTDQLSGQIGHA